MAERKKVWVEVEVVAGLPGELPGRLLHSVDIDQARASFRSLTKLTLGDGPEELFNPETPGYEEGDEAAPFMSEAYLYILLGKEHARTVLSRVRAVGQALGLDPNELP